MSVNDPRHDSDDMPHVEPFVVKGGGSPTARTFCIGHEDHTLGNALRHVLIQNHHVQFAAYSVPHPSEPMMQIRVQTQTAPPPPPSSSQPAAASPPPPPAQIMTATEALQVACTTLHAQCGVVLDRLEQILPYVKEDREQMAAWLATHRQLDEYEDDDNNYEASSLNNDNDGGNVDGVPMDES